jgi:hypothetical protein
LEKGFIAVWSERLVTTVTRDERFRYNLREDALKDADGCFGLEREVDEYLLTH